VVDGLYRAGLQSFLGLSDLCGIVWLMEDYARSQYSVLVKNGRSCLVAKPAVDAVFGDVIRTGNIFRKSMW